MTDIDKLLTLQESTLNRDTEISRIIGTYQYDYLAILDIDPTKEDFEKIASLVKKSYRKRSLLIHPDKTANKDAPGAFDKLKKAELVLSTEDKESTLWHEKTRLFDIYKDVSGSISDLSKIRQRAREILEEHSRQEEIEKLYVQRQEQQKREEETRIQSDREKQRKEKHAWEDERDSRVKNWRDYNNKIEKKKKKGVKKKKVLA